MANRNYIILEDKDGKEVLPVTDGNGVFVEGGTKKLENKLTEIDSKTTELNEQLDNVVQKQFNFIVVSDIHCNTDVGDMSGKYRVDNFIKAVQYEDSINPIHAIFINGDLSNNDLGGEFDGVQYIKDEVVDKLPIPVYCLHGNHDVSKNDRWKSIFGYEKNFEVVVGDYAIICVDSFDDDVNLIYGTFGKTPINNTRLKMLLDKYIDKKVFILSHEITQNEDAETFTLLKKYPNIQAVVCGHTHSSSVVSVDGANFKIYYDGNYSYDFGNSGVLRFLKFNSDTGYLTKHLIKPKNDLLGTERSDVEVVNIFGIEDIKDNKINKSSSESDVKAIKESINNTNKFIGKLEEDLFEEVYNVISGESITYTNNDVDMKLNIDIDGKTVVEGTPSLDTPATLKHVFPNGIDLSVNNTPVTSSIANIKSIPTISDKIIKGVYQMNVVEKTLDGRVQEVWGKAGCNNPLYSRFFIGLPEMSNEVFFSSNKTNIVCNKLESENTNNIVNKCTDGTINKECIGATSVNRTIMLTILKSRLESDDVTGLRKYLSSNPLTIIIPTTPQNRGLFKEKILLSKGFDSTITSNNTEVKPIISLRIPINTNSKVGYLYSALNDFETPVESVDAYMSVKYDFNNTQSIPTTDKVVPYITSTINAKNITINNSKLVVGVDGKYELNVRFIVRCLKAITTNNIFKMKLFKNDIEIDTFRMDINNTILNQYFTNTFTKVLRLKQNDTLQLKVTASEDGITLHNVNQLVDLNKLD